ncbi:hypothetical protein [uncultured Sphingomonas sp.]|uniref:hypothetical protein n=1 Tax=uncultured Sphingomonas sp. TaxID=158754 RepID=UPI0035CA42A6
MNIEVTPGRGLPMLAALVLLLPGCTAAPIDDDGRIVRATLTLLASGRTGAEPLCVDDRTRGEPLAIYRTMRAQTAEGDRHWRHPAPLRAPGGVSGRALFEDAVGSNRLRIAEPRSTAAALPAVDQRRLHAAATSLALVGESDAVTIGDAEAVPGASARWWLINRFRAGCDRRYLLSRIVRSASTAFVTVTADHWGTTYAVERVRGDWRVTAQWNSWLY